VDLRQLRTFVQVAETGSLTRAAERLHTVQPTLSRQIRMLEEELGSDLFARQGRGMKLTEAGDRLLEHARLILRDVETARSELLALRGTVSGNVVCGVIPSIGDRALVPFVSGFAEANPLVNLRVVTGYAGFLIDWLARRQIDLAIVYDQPGLASHEVIPLVEEPLFVVAPPHVGLDTGVAVAVATLTSVPMILPSPQHGLRKLVDGVVERHGIALNVRMEADSLQTQLELVRTGLGWTILPSSAFAADLALGYVSAAPLKDPEILRKIVVALPLDRGQPHAVRAFAEGVARHVTGMTRDGSWPGARPIR
jgi:LysR family transcriptional regulator, nitrogen assimilation regulatory protein